MQVNAYSYTGISPIVGEVKPTSSEYQFSLSIREPYRKHAEELLEGVAYTALSQRKLTLGTKRTFEVWKRMLKDVVEESYHEFEPLVLEAGYPIVVGRSECERLMAVFAKHYHATFSRNEAYFRSIYRELQTMFTIASNRESAIVIQLENYPEVMDA